MTGDTTKETKRVDEAIMICWTSDYRAKAKEDG